MSKKVFRHPFADVYPKMDPNVTAESLILIKCDGDDYGRGPVEAAKEQAVNTSQVLGRLVQLMFERGLITKLEVYKIAGCSPPDIDPFGDEEETDL